MRASGACSTEGGPGTKEALCQDASLFCCWPCFCSQPFRPRTERQARECNRPQAASPAGLWQKAVDIHRHNSDWYPERITILSEVLNRQGLPSSVTQLLFSLHMGADDAA